MNTESEIKAQLSNQFPKEIVEKLVENYLEIHSNYFLKKHREASQYGGRFAEMIVRMLQYTTQNGNYTPLGTRLPNIHNLVVQFGNLSKHTFDEAIRITIPRAIDVLYSIRNKRDVGHVGGDLSANLSDATLSIYLSSWILAELLRVYYTGDIDKAQILVDNLVSRKFSLVQDFNGFQKILRPDLSLPKKVLVLIFSKEEGVTLDELKLWLGKRTDTSYLKRVLNELEDKKAYIHLDSSLGKYKITNAGFSYIEDNIGLSFK